jgi:hypothetical protein
LVVHRAVAGVYEVWAAAVEVFARAPLHYIRRHEVAACEDVEAYLLWEI